MSCKALPNTHDFDRTLIRKMHFQLNQKMASKQEPA